MEHETKENLKSYLKEQGRAEKKKLKTMPMGEKIDYIWTYYKAQIIIAAFIIVFFISLVHHLLTGSQETILYSMVINSDVFQDDATPQIYTDFMAEKGFDPKEYKADYHAGLTLALNENGEANDLQMFSVIATLLMSGTVDHIMTDEDVVVMLGEIGYIMPMEEYLPQEKFAAYEREGKVIYGTHPDTKKKTAFGISLAESSRIKQAGLFSFSPVYAMIYAAPHQENSIDFLYFLEP